MKRITLVTLLALSSVLCFGQVDLRNKLVRQIANGDTIVSRIYTTYDTYDGTNPILVHMYDSVAYTGSRGVGIGALLKLYSNLEVNGNSNLGNASTDTVDVTGVLGLNGDYANGITEQANLTGNLANKTTTLDTVFTTYVSNGTFTEAYITITLAEDATYNLPDAKTISGDIFVSGGNERCIFTVTSAGVPLIGLSFGTIVWDDADTDGDYCLIDGGTFVTLKNRCNTGTKTFYLTLRYN